MYGQMIHRRDSRYQFRLNHLATLLRDCLSVCFRFKLHFRYGGAQAL